MLLLTRPSAFGGTAAPRNGATRTRVVAALVAPVLAVAGVVAAAPASAVPVPPWQHYLSATRSALDAAGGLRLDEAFLVDDIRGRSRLVVDAAIAHFTVRDTVWEGGRLTLDEVSGDREGYQSGRLRLSAFGPDAYGVQMRRLALRVTAGPVDWFTTSPSSSTADQALTIYLPGCGTVAACSTSVTPTGPQQVRLTMTLPQATYLFDVELNADDSIRSSSQIDQDGEGTDEITVAYGAFPITAPPGRVYSGERLSAAFGRLGVITDTSRMLRPVLTEQRSLMAASIARPRRGDLSPARTACRATATALDELAAFDVVGRTWVGGLSYRRGALVCRVVNTRLGASVTFPLARRGVRVVGVGAPSFVWGPARL